MAKVLISEEILQETAEAIKNKANIVVVGGLRPVHFAATINRIGATTGLPALPDESETVYESQHMILEHVAILGTNEVAYPRKITIRGGNHNTTSNAISSGLTNRLLVVHFDKGVTGISGNTVRLANNLYYVRIGEDVTVIRANAFQQCNHLTVVVFDSLTPPTVAAGAFPTLDFTQQIIVPEESYDAYVEALAESGLNIDYIEAYPSVAWEKDGEVDMIANDIIQNDIANS